MDSPIPLYLTTREVADLLRVKERKVYEMVSTGEIPHRKITGKLLFPKSEIMGWIEGEGNLRPAERPALVTGSHDPLLDWALRESGAGMATLWNGSSEGLNTFAEGRAALAGLHIPGETEWNIAAIEARGLRDAVLIGWARRMRGLILTPGVAEMVKDFADLRGRRVILRQEGAGTTALFVRLMAEAGLAPADLKIPASPAHTESDAAAAVAAGEAEATLGLEAMARQFRLTFRPLLRERFDLLIDRRAYFTEPVQRLVAFMRSDTVAAKAAAFGGYDTTDMGKVRWLSP
ncbi:substrate-binding domain-containing protein [Roseovarius autotrophicus]|uniref:substrate-binding domain-containing protein n=1 Tax=Roseovarius autotrophicus TaxID=2824121 RepID=UPI0019E5744C|nr:helix-turn-helix transcriptional regulator [Roseovarius autotrophicus]MBE0453696.1 helix-turn-helix transcriptional regulator [Roseovarius sp.]